MIIREIVIPFTDEDQIKKVIKFESESHLPSANIDDVVVGFYKISEQGPRSRVLIFAVEKNTLKRYLEILGSVGIEPTQVDLSSTALYSLTHLLPDIGVEEMDEDNADINVILDIGDVSTTVMVTQGPMLRMIRSMRLGAESLTRTLSADLGIDRAEARTVTQSLMQADVLFSIAGDTQSSEPSTALTAVDLKQDIIKDKQNEFARRITNEMRRTLSSVHVDGRVQGVWTTGTASTAQGLEQALREAFGVTVRPLDVLATADHRLDVSDALFVGPSLGLGLKALEHDPVGLEFRQEEFSFARKFDRVRNPLLFASALVLVLFSFLAILEWNKVQDMSKDMKFLAKRGAIEFNNLVVATAQRNSRYVYYKNGQEAETKLNGMARVDDPLDQIRAMVRELSLVQEKMTEEFGVVFDKGGSEPPELTAPRALQRLDKWCQIMNGMRAKKIAFWVDKLDVTDMKVIWTWRVPVADLTAASAYLQEEFEKLENFGSYRSGKQAIKGAEAQITNVTLEWKKR